MRLLLLAALAIPVIDSYLFNCPDQWGYHPHTAHCGSYYVCEDWVAKLKYCKEGTFYDKKKVACDWPKLVKCGRRPKREFKCPDQWGYHANPADCASYFQCKDWEPEFNKCKKGTFYDDKKVACDWPDRVDCGSRPKRKMCRGGSESLSRNSLPAGKIMAVYLAISSDSAPGSTKWDDWTPKLYDYQQEAANVLMLTFINPADMEVPLSFKNMAAKKGSCMKGAVPKDTVLLFSIGGQAYSKSVNPWPWLESKSAAEAMADKVATWPDLYPGMDGVDVDIEHGAGEVEGAGENLVHFLRRLKKLKPDMVVVVPTYGYPQIPAENAAINAAWSKSGRSRGLVDSIGIMAYDELESLDWVDEYTEPTWWPDWWPIKADVPEQAIMVGVRGTASPTTFQSAAREVKSLGLGGIIVWYATVSNGAKNLYESSWDTSGNNESKQGFENAAKILNKS